MLPFLREHFGTPRAATPTGRSPAPPWKSPPPGGPARSPAEEIVFTSGGSEATTPRSSAWPASSAREPHVVTVGRRAPAVLEPLAPPSRRGLPGDPSTGRRRRRVDGTWPPLSPPRRSSSPSCTRTTRWATIEPWPRSPPRSRASILVHTAPPSRWASSPSTSPSGGRPAEPAPQALRAQGRRRAYVRSGVDLPRFLHGAGQESGRRRDRDTCSRSWASAEACAIASGNLEANGDTCRRCRPALGRAFAGGRGLAEGTAAPSPSCRTRSRSAFGGVEASTLREIGERVAASAAPLHPAGVELIPVLEAMRVPMRYAGGRCASSVGRRHGPSRRSTSRCGSSRRRSGASARSRARHGRGGQQRGEAHPLHPRTSGCACKLRPQDSSGCWRKLPRVQDPAVLVGTETSDDAAVSASTGARPRRD